MASWYIQGNNCFRCSNMGLVPSLEWKQKTDGKYWFEKVWGCDCQYRRKAPNITPYGFKYHEDFQFFFTPDIMRASKPHITYHEVFYVYNDDFWKRYRTDKDAKPRTDYELLQAWIVKRNAMDWSRISTEVDQTLLNLT